jgi:hypothetical protein
MKGFDLFFIPKPFEKDTSWQAIRALEFRAKPFSATVLTYLVTLLALLARERMKRTPPYLGVDFS